MLAHEAAEPQVVGVVDDGVGSIREAAATMAPTVAELAILRRTPEPLVESAARPQPMTPIPSGSVIEASGITAGEGWRTASG
jgi:hypothetical protein